MANAKDNLTNIAKQLADEVGHSTAVGYIEGKRKLENALAEILDGGEDEAARTIRKMQDRGYLKFINRVGFDSNDPHWRIVPRPL